MRSRLSKGANVNRKNSDGFPAIVIAADKRNKQLIEFLLDHGARIDAPSDGRGETALMRRVTVGDSETVTTLLAAGADPNLADKSGITSLMRAAQGRKARIVKLLLDNGADVDRADYTGKTALGYARDAKARRVVRVLEEAGARF